VAIEYASVQVASDTKRPCTGENMIGPNHMIEFPNHSRSYDQTRRAVRFWGHDSAIEASFF